MQRVLEDYQRNVTEPMMEGFAKQLNVKPEILYRLGVGFAEKVQWKEGWVDEAGYWAIPERGPRGQVIAIGMRSIDGDRKLMLPGGSGRGWIFEVDPKFNPVIPPYVPGPHNWQRIHEVNMECPVCGHGNGCLVSREPSIEDPQAVICIMKETSEPRGEGWLHRLKPEAFLRSANHPLPESKLPVVIVEGFTDVATAMELGFVGLGRPNWSVKSKKQLLDLIRGRKVIVMGENDSGVGKDGMDQTFQAIHREVEAVKLMPPKNVKDLRQWHQNYGLTANELLGESAKRGSTDAGDIFSTKSSEHIARLFLNHSFTSENKRLLRKKDSQWFLYNDGRYEIVKPDRIKKPMFKFLEGRKYYKGDGSIARYDLTNTRIGDIIGGLTAYCPVEEDPPAWINGVEGPKQVIAYRNGLLDVDAYLQGKVRLLPPTPDYFNLSCLPFDFDEDAVCSDWLSWGNVTLQPLAFKALKQWYGYCLIADNRFQKICLFKGPPGSGKSTAVYVLEGILGEDNVGSATIQSLGDRFGRSSLIGKLAVVLGEARSSISSNPAQALDTLLTISGDDKVYVNVKYQDPVSLRLTARFTLLLNVIPRLPDYAHALTRRLHIIPFTQTFIEGRADRGMSAKLRRELPGITNWALQGLVELHKQGDFTEAEGVKEIMEDIKKIMSPIADFAGECCEEGGGEIDRGMLYDCWLGWAKVRNMRAGTPSWFFENLQPILKTAKIQTHKVLGLQLKNSAHIYLGKPM